MAAGHGLWFGSRGPGGPGWGTGVVVVCLAVALASVRGGVMPSVDAL